MSSKKVDTKTKRRKYQNKVIRNLSILLIINSLVYLVYSPRLIGLNIDVVTQIVTEIRNIISFNYNLGIFALINFLLISLASVKILLIGRRLPIMLIFILLFTIKFDDILALRLGESAVFVRNTLDMRTSTLSVAEDIVALTYNVEYFNYLITIFMPIYLLIKRMTFDALFIKIDKIVGIHKEKKKSNVTAKNSTRKNNINYSNGGGYKVNSSPRTDYSNYYDNYDDLDNETYTRNNLYDNKETLTIMSDYDKQKAYEMSIVDPFGKVIDESGIERSAWEYASIYEEEKRKEEFNFQQEQFLYNSNSNNDYPIYDPYDNNDYTGNNYYDNDTYNSSYDNYDTYSNSYDDYYGNSYDNDYYGDSYDNDSYF